MTAQEQMRVLAHSYTDVPYANVTRGSWSQCAVAVEIRIVTDLAQAECYGIKMKIKGDEQ